MLTVSNGSQADPFLSSGCSKKEITEKAANYAPIAT